MVFVLVLSLVLANLYKDLYAQSIEEVLDRIQSFYNQIESLRGAFTQETLYPDGKREVRSGKFWIKKPGRFRWEYYLPEKFIIISDNRNIYVYYPEENQVYVYPGGKAISSQLALGFMSGRGDIRSDLKIESFKTSGKELNFLPNYQDAQVEKISLKVNIQTGEVLEMLLYYFSGERLQLLFSKLEYNIEIPDKNFKFKPPKNVKIN